jgi:hypothetical protein
LLTAILNQTTVTDVLCEAPNGNSISRAQGLPTDQDDDHVKYLSQKARVFGVGWMLMLGTVSPRLAMVCLCATCAGLGRCAPPNGDALSIFARVLRLGTALTLACQVRSLAVTRRVGRRVTQGGELKGASPNEQAHARTRGCAAFPERDSNLSLTWATLW